MIGPRQVRCSQRDRDAVESVLRRAYEDGRLDGVEFAERLEALHAAKTYADLEPLVRDVPHSLPFLDPVIAPGDKVEQQRGARVPASRAPRRGPGAVLRTVLIVYLIVLVISATPWFLRPMMLLVAVVTGGVLLLARTKPGRGQPSA